MTVEMLEPLEDVVGKGVDEMLPGNAVVLVVVGPELLGTWTDSEVAVLEGVMWYVDPLMTVKLEAVDVGETVDSGVTVELSIIPTFLPTMQAVLLYGVGAKADFRVHWL